MAPKKIMKQKEFVAKLVTESKEPCVFCDRKVDDEIIYGKLYMIGDIQCHYFCVLLASCLVQKGKDNEGLFGFLYKDIVAEVERSKKHKCSYCNRGGATLGCDVVQCRKQFHLPCGRERNCISLFYGTYKSFCQVHAPKQKIMSNIISKIDARRKNAKKVTNGSVNEDNDKTDVAFVCAICYEEVDPLPSVQTFWPPCCARDAWIHRPCLQRMALSAGIHYLKCPLCNDRDAFHEAVVSQGYYVPDRDAAWELEQNAFAEIYERNISCNVDVCKCPMGRNHDEDNGVWELRSCLLCGSSGAHAHCAYAESDSTGPYICSTCRPVAPEDLDNLVKTVEAVILTEQNRRVERPRRRIMIPARMSLRWTKARNNMPSCSSSEGKCLESGVSNNTITSRQELNLKTPKRHQNSLESVLATRNIENLFSPVKLLEQGLREKITQTVIDFSLDEKLLDDMRRKFKKPRPLSEKRRIVTDIISGIFDNDLKEPKQKETAKEWCSPKKISDVIEFHEEATDSQKHQKSLIIGVDKFEKLDKVIGSCEKTFNFSNDQIKGSRENVLNSPKAELDSDGIELNVLKEQMGGFENEFNDSRKQSDSREKKMNCSIEKLLNDANEFDSSKVETDSHNNELNDSKEESDSLEIELTSSKEEIDGFINESDSLKKVEDYSDDSASTFQLPPEFLGNDSNDSVAILKTPKKLTNVDMQKDSSLEISENDQIVNIDVVKMETNSLNAESFNPKSPFKIKKCAFKFNPVDKKILEKHNLGINMECFKKYYLNEVDKDFKVNNVNLINEDVLVYNEGVVGEKVKKNGVKRKKNYKKRKLEDEKTERNEVNSKKVKLTFKSGEKYRKRNEKRNRIKIKLSLNDDNIPLRIKWKKQELKLKISNGKNNKMVKNDFNVDSKNFKQYILNPSSSKEVIVKPEKDITPPKRKYNRHEKKSDNLFQTSLKSFFVKKPEEF